MTDEAWFDDLEEYNDDPDPTYFVETRSFCGMTLPHGERETYQEAERVALNRIAYLEKLGAEVTKLGEGEWEILEPDNCAMVPDWAGVMVIRRR